MKIGDILFSNKRMFRFGRHFLFWSFLLFLKFLFAVSAYLTSPDTISTSLFSLKIMIPELIIFIAYCYAVAYWLLPSYLMKKKYWMFGAWLLLLTVLAEGGTLYLWGFNFRLPKGEMVFLIWMKAINFVNGGPHVICSLFLTIKVLKTWYVKEEERVILTRENAYAELQQLKAQVHPHFLFNTLNNIYSFALDKSPKAPGLVLKLSAVIKYMINDCEASLVSVEKEIKMIEDYIGLEKVRYGNRLHLQVQIRVDHKNKGIAPFLLIPFVENSFKHGASEILEHPWITLAIVVNNEDLYFELCNSKPSLTPVQNEKKGIGLSNVEKRLQLLYPKSHELIITNQETQFTVIMRVPLQNVPQRAVEYEVTPLRDALPTLS